MGAQAAAGITTFNQFWVYVIPLFGKWLHLIKRVSIVSIEC